jgi:uncharacterized repeat protein (TIGR02543 family)
MKRFLNMFMAIIMCVMMISSIPIYAEQINWYDDSSIFWDASYYEIVDLGFKPVTVTFNVELDNEYRSLTPHVIRIDGDTLYSGFTTIEGAKLPRVKGPFKPGYTFIGWRDLDDDEEKIWNHDMDKITKDTNFVAVFKKGSTFYKVKFDSNGGTPIKDVTIEANDSINKPIDPTKEGYRFTGWHKDSACTQPWDFVNDVVEANITLYAGWIDPYAMAMPTTSTVLVDGMPREFEAYNIKGNNYFKLRDLAQAVNNTVRNFEVTWDGINNAINLLSNTPYTPVGGELAKGDGQPKTAVLSTSAIYKDGKEIYPTAYNINGNNYFKLRDIAEAFGIGVTWDGVTNTIGINTTEPNKEVVVAEGPKEEIVAGGSESKAEDSEAGKIDEAGIEEPAVETEEPAIEDDYDKNLFMLYFTHKNKGVQIDLTDTKESIYQKLGTPTEIYQSGNNEIWLYDNGHGDFTEICLYNDKVEIINTVSELWKYRSIFPAGSSVDNIDLVKDAGGYDLMDSVGIKRFENEDFVGYVYNSYVGVDYGSRGKLTFYIDNNLKTLIGFTIEKPSKYLNFSFESFTDKELGKLVFYYTNAYRSRLNKEPLIWSEDLYQAAYNHTKDMFDRDFFGHDSPTEKFWDRVTRELGRGYKSEVLYQAKNVFNPIHALAGWMKSSPGHREATLSDTYKYGGTSLMGTKADLRCTQLYFTPLD